MSKNRELTDDELDAMIARHERVAAWLRSQKTDKRIRRQIAASERALSLGIDPKTNLVIATRGRDRGTPERHQHDEFVQEGTGAAHLRVVTQNTLDRYFRRKELDPDDEAKNLRLWKAGDRLRCDWMEMGAMPRVIAKLDGLPGGGVTDQTIRQINAQSAYVAAIEAVGRHLSPVLDWVCCRDGTASEWAERRGFVRPKDGIVILRVALQALADHYA